MEIKKEKSGLSKVAKTLLSIIIAAAVFGFVLLAVFLMDDDDSHAATENTFSVGGRVVFNGGNLEDVELKISGKTVTTSNEYGIFLLKNLKKDTVITFVAENFEFSPSEITVTESRYDYLISATLISPEEPPIPDDPETPVDPETPEEPIDPEKPEKPDPDIPDKIKLPSVKNIGFVVLDNNSYLLYSADARSEQSVLTVNNQSVTLDTVKKDFEFEISGVVLTVSFLEALILDDNIYFSYSINVTPLALITGDTVSIRLIAEGFLPSDETTVGYALSMQLPKIASLSFHNDTFYWDACVDELGASFDNVDYYILVNSVSVAHTSNCFFALSELSLPLPAGEYRAEIIAIKDGFLPGRSEIIQFTIC